MRKFYYQILSFFSGIIRFYFRKNLRVLAFHDVPDKTVFAKNIQYLKRYYNIVDIQTLKKFLYKGEELPEYAVLITFDDGDRSILTNGLPILKDQEVSSCLFIVTSYINTSNGFWWKAIREREKEKETSPLKITEKMDLFKKVRNKERLKAVANYPPIYQKQLSLKDLIIMQRNGMYIGNHTHTHPMLNTCTETEIRHELISSKILFNKWEIEGFKVFAYPNGSWDSNSEKILRENDIELAFLFDHKVNSLEISPLRISRIKTNADMPLSEFKVKASGLHSLISQPHMNSKW